MKRKGSEMSKLIVDDSGCATLFFLGRVLCLLLLVLFSQTCRRLHVLCASSHSLLYTYVLVVSCTQTCRFLLLPAFSICLSSVSLPSTLPVLLRLSLLPLLMMLPLVLVHAANGTLSLLHCCSAGLSLLRLFPRKLSWCPCAR